jgi:acyl-coenzyme A thioesterase PaaI-like protein
MVVAVWTWFSRFVPVATISLNMNFMRPSHGAVITETRLQRVGRRVIFGDAAMRDADTGDLLAQAAMTYTVLEEKAS